MSAPETNIERQKRRHWGPLIGIAAVIIFAVLIGIYYLGYLSFEGNTPGTGDVEADAPVVNEVPAAE